MIVKLIFNIGAILNLNQLLSDLMKITDCFELSYMYLYMCTTNTGQILFQAKMKPIDFLYQVSELHSP